MIIGRSADVQERDYRFARSQSRLQRGQDWLSREKPVESIGKQVLEGIGFAIFLAAVVLITSWVR